MNTSAATVCALLACALAACAEVEPRAAVTPDYDHDIRPILEARCASCHDVTSPAAGWSALRFPDVIACVAPDGGVATRLSAALDRPDHATLLDAAQRAAVRTWLDLGAPASRGALHDPGFADPRAPTFHGRALRRTRWLAMLDPDRPESCGRCHEGAPTRPAGARYAARNAPACTTCHTEPQGALACNTCHGGAGHAWPPRDACLHPESAPDAHATHVSGAVLGIGPLSCETCHPARTTAQLATGAHGDGYVDLAFDPVRAGATASYDRATHQCSVACHNRGGARATPDWRDQTSMRCNDCHGAPPPNHSPGPCTTCHHEANATGSALAGGPFHLNGRVDLGDGSGTCSACHTDGHGTDGWPATGSHPAHRNPTGGAAVACGDCHAVPAMVSSPGHLDATLGPEVRFSGRAVARGATPTYAAGACANVACHGAGLPGASTVPVRWGDDTGSARRCGTCHSVPPPPPQHPTSQTCEALQCHGGELTPTATGHAITPEGRLLHQNGSIDVGGSAR